MRNHKGTKIRKIFYLLFVIFVSLWFSSPSITTTIQIPSGETLLLIRFGKRKSPSGILQTHIGVLTEEKTEGRIPSFSYLRTFVPGRNEPVIEIKRQNQNRYNNFSFVDFAGDGDQYLACFTVKSQSFLNEKDLTAKVEILDSQGQKRDSVVLESKDKNGGSINPDFGQAGIVRVEGRDYLVVGPQNSFMIGPSGGISSTNIYFFKSSNGRIQHNVVNVPSTNQGDTVERTMLASGDLGKGHKSTVIFSKSLVLVFNPTNGDLEARRQIVDSASTDPNVMNVPVDNDIPDSAGGRPMGRRYGQFRIVRQQLVLTAHSQPIGSNTDCDNPDSRGLESLYTVYRNPLSSGSYLAPIAGWKRANPNPMLSDRRTNFFRFFKYAVKKLDDKNPKRRRYIFLNGQLLLGGTPPNGIEDLGDGSISIIVNDAPPPPKIDCPDPVQTSLVPKIYILDAKNGKDKLQSPFPNSVALDVLKAPDKPARILIWGGITDNENYNKGHLQVVFYDQKAHALIPLSEDGSPAAFEENHEPLLMGFNMLNNIPEDIGVSTDRLAQKIFTATIGSSRAFLTLRIPEGRFIDAFDIETLKQIPEKSRLDPGENSVLLATLDDLPVTCEEPVLNGSVFVIQDNDTQTIRFLRISPQGKFVPCTLTN